MKYIRTNYLFGEIISHTKLSNGTHLFSIKGLDEILPISEEDFEKCKFANTIEELCDEKVGTYEDKSKPYIYKKASWSDLKKGWAQFHYNIYGAIWTDKGLIYVAKMNENGELELL